MLESVSVFVVVIRDHYQKKHMDERVYLAESSRGSVYNVMEAKVASSQGKNLRDHIFNHT